MAINSEEFQKKFHFTYTNSLVFCSEKEKNFVQKQILTHPPLEHAIKLGHQYGCYINQNFIPDVEVRYVPTIDGFGLYTQRDFKKGEYIGEYTGLITAESFYLKMKNYLLSYPISSKNNKPYSIDAEPFGNHTRFINHSFNPNLNKMYMLHQDFYHMIFISNNPIQKNTQLTFDYGKNYWYLRGAPIDF